MSTLFEDADNTNPPSPPLDDLLEAPLKNDLDNKADDDESPTEEVASVQNQQSNGNSNAFTPFVNDPSNIPNQVRVVHVQVPEGGSQQSDSDVNSHVNPSSSGTLYTVGNGGQIQQMISHNDQGSGLTSVSVDASQQDPSRYTYYPAVQTADNAQTSGQQQFYVMMSPQDVIPVTGNNTPRIIAPRAQSLSQKVENSRSSRDERRRATHNEVERRRRDKINTWIMKLAAVVPDCQSDQSKQGTSKGGVLSKALDHIIKIRAHNDRMAETIKEQERILVENQVLRQQVEKLRQENSILQANNIQLRQSDNVVEDEQVKPMEAE